MLRPPPSGRPARSRRARSQVKVRRSCSYVGGIRCSTGGSFRSRQSTTVRRDQAGPKVGSRQGHGSAGQPVGELAARCGPPWARCSRKKSRARSATRSRAPVSSKRWVAPGTTTRLAFGSCCWACRLSCSTGSSRPPTTSSVAARTPEQLRAREVGPAAPRDDGRHPQPRVRCRAQGGRRPGARPEEAERQAPAAGLRCSHSQADASRPAEQSMSNTRPGPPSSSRVRRSRSTVAEPAPAQRLGRPVGCGGLAGCFRCRARRPRGRAVTGRGTSGGLERQARRHRDATSRRSARTKARASSRKRTTSSSLSCRSPVRLPDRPNRCSGESRQPRRPPRRPGDAASPRERPARRGPPARRRAAAASGRGQGGGPRGQPVVHHDAVRPRTGSSAAAPVPLHPPGQLARLPLATASRSASVAPPRQPPGRSGAGTRPRRPPPWPARAGSGRRACGRRPRRGGREAPGRPRRRRPPLPGGDRGRRGRRRGRPQLRQPASCVGAVAGTSRRVTSRCGAPTRSRSAQRLPSGRDLGPERPVVARAAAGVIRAPPPGRVEALHRARVPQRDLAHDREPEAGAGHRARLLRAVEAVEDVRQVGRRRCRGPGRRR